MCGKSDDLVLPGPFDRQITEARDSQAVRQAPIDCGLDEFGRQKSQRYGHVDLAHAACGAGRDGLGRGIGIFDQLLEPTAPPQPRSLFPGNQILRPEKEGAKMAMSITPVGRDLDRVRRGGMVGPEPLSSKIGCSFESDQLPG